MNQNCYLQLLQVLKRSSTSLWILVFMFLIAGEVRANTHNERIAMETTTACGITVEGCKDEISVKGIEVNRFQVRITNNHGQTVFYCNSQTCNTNEMISRLSYGRYIVDIRQYNANFVQTCVDAVTIILSSSDCEDKNSGSTGSTNTGTVTIKHEKCDGKDNDGDGLIDEGFIDSDRDGTADCVDGCPLDASKTSPGLCGCGRTEEPWDSDNDGVVDCNDVCPMNPTKSKDAGICGCDFNLNQESRDSDRDGLLDCEDPCPRNRYQPSNRACGCEAPEILKIEVVNLTACNPFINSFTADIIIHFDYPPRLGGLTFRGDFNHYHNFDNNNTSNVLKLEHRNFIADGGPIEFIAEYKGNEGCNFAFKGRNAPAACMNVVTPISSIPTRPTGPLPVIGVTTDCGIQFIGITNVTQCNDAGTRFRTSDDFYRADIIVRFFNPPSEGMLKLTGASNIWIDVAKLQGKTSIVIPGVRLPATGENFELGATFSHGRHCTYVQRFTGISINDENRCSDCNIQSVRVSSIRCEPGRLAVDLFITGGNTGAEYTLNGVFGHHTGTYNELSTFTIFDQENIEIEVIDRANPSCAFFFRLDPSNCVAFGRTNENTWAANFTIGDFMNFSPNPAHSELLIDYAIPASRKIENATVVIYDLLGRQTIVKQLTDQKAKTYLDISQLENGLHLITLNMDGLLFTSKFLKEDWR